MKNLLSIMFVFVFGLVSSSAFAQAYVNKNEMKLVKGIEVTVIDEVSDGCLPNPNTLKTEAELILRRAGVQVDNPSYPYYYLQISTLGWKLKGMDLCVVRWDIELIRASTVPEGHRVLVQAFSSGGLIVNLKTKMKGVLRQKVQEQVSELANEILKARSQ